MDGWMVAYSGYGKVNVGGRPFSGLYRDAQMDLGQGSGWPSQDRSQTCSEATPLLYNFCA